MHRYRFRANTTAVAALAFLATVGQGSRSAAAAPEIPAFSFIHISDIHIAPHPQGTAPTDSSPSVATIRWICGEAAKTQAQEPYGVTAAPPSFVIATGDLTEYGVIGETWPDFEQATACLPCHLHVVPGNHDNTWVSMNHLLRRRYGNDSWSFSRFGCHFVGLNTTTTQEPVPSLDRRTLNWLRNDLRKIDRDTPVFLFMHHPLYTTEYAALHEQLRLLDAIEGRTIALILDGHGHNPTPGRWENIDRVMGGSTYGPQAGYNVVSVIDGTLRVTYRYHDGRPSKPMLEKSLSGRPPACTIRIDEPPPNRPTAPGVPVSVVAGVAMNGATARAVRFDVDAPDKITGTLHKQRDVYNADFSADALLPGWHFLRVSVTDDTERTWNRAASFEILAAASARIPLDARRHQHSSGVKATPLPLDDIVIVADTAGAVTAWDRAFRQKWRFAAGGEVLGTPTAAGDLLLFGSGDGFIYAIQATTGAEAWRYDAGAPVFASPVVHGRHAFVGDNAGCVHAIDVTNGRKHWSARHAEFGIEAAGTIAGDAFCVGAWDGWVYALRLGDGGLAWRQRCPTGQGGQPSRYYAAADCPPVMAGGRLFVTDRGYCLGMYRPDGSYIRQLQKNCSAVGLSEDGRFVYARTLADGLTKYDAEGTVVWQSDVALGRFPIPPTEQSGKVYVCSNRGLLSVLDAADGRTLWRYQVSPQLHVMAGVAVDRRGVAWTADMDGGVVAVGPRATE